MEMKEQKISWLNTRYSIIQASYWMSYAAVFAFGAVFLLSRGFDNRQIGVIMAMGNCCHVLILMADYQISLQIAAAALCSILFCESYSVCICRKYGNDPRSSACPGTGLCLVYTGICLLRKSEYSRKGSCERTGLIHNG